MGTLHHLKPAPQSVAASPDGPDDPALIDRCRRGDRQALECVLRAHTDYLERLLIRVAGPALAPDALQGTLIAAVQAFPRFRGEARVRTWLARIAVRMARAELRRGYRGPQLRADGLLVDSVSPGRTPEEATGQERALARVQDHLDAMGPKKRIAFMLHVVEGHSMEEVAALMDAGVSATKSRVYWARKELLKKARRDPALRAWLPGGGETP